LRVTKYVFGIDGLSLYFCCYISLTVLFLIMLFDIFCLEYELNQVDNSQQTQSQAILFFQKAQKGFLFTH